MICRYPHQYRINYNVVLGSGTSGTVFKMNFKRKDVAVKQIAKSDDKDEMKVSKSTFVIFALYQF